MQPHPGVELHDVRTSVKSLQIPVFENFDLSLLTGKKPPNANFSAGVPFMLATAIF